MHLANGQNAIFVAIILTLLIGFYFISLWIKRNIVRKAFSEKQKSVLLAEISPALRTVKIVCLVAGLLLCGFSVLDPRWGTRSREYSIEGIDVAIVLDVSRSMLTPDVLPNRLEYTKKLASQLLNLLAGNRVGLAAFAGYGFNVIPLTTDLDSAGIFLQDLSPDMIDVQGTNLEDAIRKALELFDMNTLTHKVIVIFTDGEDTEFSPMKEVKIAKDRGITIFTVGIGTPAGGEIPLLDEKGNKVDTLKKNNQTVVSRLNGALLRKISGESGGLFFQGDETGVAELFRKIDEVKKTRFGNGIYELMEPQYQIFLLPGIILLLLFLFLPERKIVFGKKNALLLVLLPLLALIPVKGIASDASRGVKEYREGNYEESLKDFQKAIIGEPKNEKYRFNEGNVYYKLGDYDRAAQNYFNLTNSDDPKIREKAYYNLGGSFLEKKDFDNAVRQYQAVLEKGDPRSPIYKKTLQNYLYAKQQKKENQNQNQGDKNNPQNQKNQQKQNQNQNQNQKNDSKQGDEKQKQNQEKQREATPQSLSDAESLLNLIAEEEKKHLARKEKNDKVIRANPQNDW